MANLTCGFYATDNEVFYVAPSGRCWIVSTPDNDNTPEEIKPEDVPANANDIDDLLTADEAIDYCRQVQEASGEILLEKAE